VTAPTDIQGWLTDAQAERLRAAARRLGATATVVEIGSFHGRSAVVLAQAAPAGTEVVCIDPHLGSDRGPQEIAADHERGQGDFETFHANLARHGVADAVRHVRALSADALDAVPGAVDLLYVDGAHRFRPAGDDLVRWGARVSPGGTMLVHDSFSSIGVTLALLWLLLLGGDFVYAGRERSLAEYRRVGKPLSPGERTRNAVRQLAELPWFARNVLIKVAIVARAPAALLRLLGHDSRDWPY
jgi:SAM-dependent methyltransferase